MLVLKRVVQDLEEVVLTVEGDELDLKILKNRDGSISAWPKTFNHEGCAVFYHPGQRGEAFIVEVEEE